MKGEADVEYQQRLNNDAEMKGFKTVITKWAPSVCRPPHVHE